MKKYIILFSLITLLSCGVSPGDRVKISSDIPAADSRMHAEDLDYYIKNDKKEAMRLYYLGHAFRLEKGETIRVLYVDKIYAQISYKNEIYWVNKKNIK